MSRDQQIRVWNEFNLHILHSLIKTTSPTFKLLP